MTSTTHLVFEGIALAVIYFIAWDIYTRVRRRNDLKNLAGPAPSSFAAGCLGEFYSLDGMRYHQGLTSKYGSVAKLMGPFGDPHIYISDPRALENILLKQSEAFDEPDYLVNTHLACFGEGVGSVSGPKHKKQRKRLGPSLTPNSIKRMAPQFYRITHELGTVFNKRITKADGSSAEIDVLRWLSRAALEMIAQGGMGYSFDTLQDTDKPHPYPTAAGELTPTLEKLPSMMIMWLHPLTKFGTPAIRRFLASLVPLEAAKELRQILDVMDSTVLEVFRAKKEVMAWDKIAWNLESERNPNIISNLLSENKKVSVSDSLTEDEIIGQMNALIFAAHDTTSGALTRALHVLALDQDLQTRLRKEVSEARAKDGDLEYEALMALPLLDAVVREILRLYPPVATMPRYAKRDAVLPLHFPVLAADGKTQLKEIFVRKGTLLHIGIIGSNQNAATWGPDAGEFKPERWLNPLPDSVKNAHIPGVFSHLMTFFGGPRSCMGMRFSILEMKIVLTVLLEAFEFSPSDKEIGWLKHHIMAPHVADDPYGTFRLPLNVSLVKETIA